MDVGAIPDSEFNEAVECDDPPTVTALAEQGIVIVDILHKPNAHGATPNRDAISACVLPSSLSALAAAIWLSRMSVVIPPRLAADLGGLIGFQM